MPRRTFATVAHDWMSISLILAWAIVPPLILLLEYIWMGTWSTDKLPNVEAFKYARETAEKFWAASLVFLVFLYAGKIPGS
jgi:hypothetical protein